MTGVAMSGNHPLGATTQVDSPPAVAPQADSLRGDHLVVG